MKLHLGCGKRYLEGFLHIDIADFDHIDYKSSVDRLPMIDDNSVDLIYASHVIEYFDPIEVVEVLKDWKRVLKTDGILRLAVPNFQALIEIYIKTKDIKKILGPLYGMWETEDNKFIFHKTTYDEVSLKNILEDIGFTSVTKWRWQEVFKDNPDYDDHSQAYYPHMDKVNGLHVSLNLECIK